MVSAKLDPMILSTLFVVSSLKPTIVEAPASIVTECGRVRVVERVEARTADIGVPASAGIEVVVARAAVDRVVAGPVINDVVPRASVQRIVAITAVQGVVAAAAVDLVVSGAAVDGVVATVAGQRIVECRTDDAFDRYKLVGAKATRRARRQTDGHAIGRAGSVDRIEADAAIIGVVAGASDE